MAIIQNMLLSALSSGGRTSRYGDFIIVTMPSAAFATTAQEYTTVQTWARSRASLGNQHRDRSAFVDRFGAKASKAKQAQKSKGKGGQRRSGNPAKAAQEAAAAKEKAAAQAVNPFGLPAGEDVDYEAAAANLDLPKDFSKFLK